MRYKVEHVAPSLPARGDRARHRRGSHAFLSVGDHGPRRRDQRFIAIAVVIRRGIRPSTTQSTSALWAKSLLNAVLFFAVFMIALPWVAHRLWPAPLPLPPWLRIAAGATLGFGGVAVWIYCLDVFSRRGCGTPFALDAPRHLVTGGPYGVVRNTIMAGELAVVWGEALYLASPGVLLYAAVLTLAGHVLVISIEEPELRERFGEQYDTYCRRVPRWLPRWRRRRSAAG
jgi:protein-S-isoprenylcysteine O-methyltransferase Ste14